MRKAYPGIHCAPADDSSDYPSFPYCAGKAAPHRYIWFGQDPVGTITVSTQPLDRR